MPTKRPVLATDEIYHVILRGVDGRDIFASEKDYYRAIQGLYESNDLNPTNWQFRRDFEDSPRTGGIWIKPGEVGDRDELVDIMAFCFMPNHIHLLLKQVKDNGISLFMRKWGTGYVSYFNRCYQRQGHLFQGRFKAVHIKTDEQLRIVFVYIHTNPAFLVDKGWKGDGVADPAKVIRDIEGYKWSSYSDYLGKKNLPLVTNRELFNEIMTTTEWRKFVNTWVQSKSVTDFGDIAFE